jgi:hypothetical protein
VRRAALRGRWAATLEVASRTNSRKGKPNRRTTIEMKEGV